MIAMPPPQLLVFIAEITKQGTKDHNRFELYFE